jgi:hypothetical protein
MASRPSILKNIKPDIRLDGMPFIRSGGMLSEPLVKPESGARSASTSYRTDAFYVNVVTMTQSESVNRLD